VGGSARLAAVEFLLCAQTQDGCFAQPIIRPQTVGLDGPRSTATNSKRITPFVDRSGCGAPGVVFAGNAVSNALVASVPAFSTSSERDETHRRYSVCDRSGHVVAGSIRGQHGSVAMTLECASKTQLVELQK